MHWSSSLSTHVWIFSVGRGNAAFVRSALNQGFLLDIGSGEEFDPIPFLRSKILPHLDAYVPGKPSRVAQAVLSHPHLDHIRGCAVLAEDSPLYPSLLTCPHDRTSDTIADESVNWKRVKNPVGSDATISAYRSLYQKRCLPLQTILFNSKRYVPNLEYGVFYIRPPVCEQLHESDDNKYVNATSIMFYLRHGNQSILFPGDMTPEGMSYILGEGAGSEKRFTRFSPQEALTHPEWHNKSGGQPSLKSLLQQYGLTVLVAPHHGLESCFSSDLYRSMRDGKPGLVVISEKRKTDSSEGTVDSRYQSSAGATSLSAEIEGIREDRMSISTVNGHHYLIVFSGTGPPKVFGAKSPESLLAKLSL